MFENYVNYAGSKTDHIQVLDSQAFENYVNYAGSKTIYDRYMENMRLRTM